MGRKAGSETRAPGDGLTDKSVKDFFYFFSFANLPFKTAPTPGKATQQIEKDGNDRLVGNEHSEEWRQESPRHSMQSVQIQNEFVGDLLFQLQFSWVQYFVIQAVE